MSRCNPNPRYILNKNANVTNTNITNQARSLTEEEQIQQMDAYLNAVYLNLLYGIPIGNIPVPQNNIKTINKQINSINPVNCKSSIASVDLVQLPSIPQICPVMKIKKAFFFDSIYKRCLKIHYSQLVTQGNNPNISNLSRVSQILSSGSLGGRVVFVANGGANGQREGQPGGVVPPLRNRF